MYAWRHHRICQLSTVTQPIAVSALPAALRGSRMKRMRHDRTVENLRVYKIGESHASNEILPTGKSGK